LLQHSVKQSAEGPAEVSGSRALQALQFLKDDEKQLIQLRREGFSFNRLAPYDSLDTYLPEIERTWNIYREMIHPTGLRRIALRYINRLLLPLDGGNLRLSDHLENAPQLPEGTNLAFTGFLHQHQAVEVGTGHKVAIIITSQANVNGELPIILDITTSKDCRTDPSHWEDIRDIIFALRDLKNQVFKRSLTESCLNRYLPQP
jgi:uncharacterized protein (TIGR04255 family)